jgi:transcriptional repressor of cell division inhibition gene dicB
LGYPVAILYLHINTDWGTVQTLNFTQGKKMTTDEAIAYFGDRKQMAQALGIGLHGTYRWGDHPPKLRQFEIERLSDGELKADD